MSSEKYVNYYIELLTNTMHDAIIRNVSLQANAKISDEIIQDLQKKLADCKNDVEESLTKEKNKSSLLEQERSGLNEEIVRLRSVQSEYEKIKNQVQHIDTFRNELNKTREELNSSQRVHTDNVNALKQDHQNEINQLRQNYENQVNELKEKIEYLQLTPAKRKKVDELKAQKSSSNTGAEISKQEEATNVEDGGSF